MSEIDFVGVDVSKATFNVCLIRNNKFKHKRFKNSADGAEAFSVWLSGLGVTAVHACLEATGPYGESLAERLHDQGVQVSMVNPARIKGFSQSHLERTKTDKKDATLIAQFCQMMQPKLWQPLPPKQRQLRDWVRRLEALIDMRQQELNRLEGAGNEVREQINVHLAGLDEQIEQTRQRIRDLIDDDPDLKQQHDLLKSIPGVGEATIAVILSEFGQIERFTNAKALAAYVGVAPRLRQSGIWKGRTTLSKTGRSQLRKAFFMPALVALRHNPVFIALKKRLTAAGKTKMAIVGAAMRKLIHVIYGVLKTKTPFNPKTAAPGLDL